MSHRKFTMRDGWRGIVLACLAVLLSACSDADHTTDGKVVIKYWEKWNGPEGEAMRAVVDDFNASQDKIFVDYSTVSEMDRRLMLAIAGGVPPDVAGVYGKSLPVYAENNALMPLDKLTADAGIRRDQYIDVFWAICCYRGHLWALPTTPDTLALIWNKKLFRAAGLDPEKPPTSIAELEQFNEKLVKRRPDGRLASCGFLPSEPGWWNETWGLWFGASLWDGNKTITANSPENVAAYDWIATYPKRFGPDDLLAFREGFGNFASPQNPFFTGRVAMVLQGPMDFQLHQEPRPGRLRVGRGAFSFGRSRAPAKSLAGGGGRAGHSRRRQALARSLRLHQIRAIAEADGKALHGAVQVHATARLQPGFFQEPSQSLYRDISGYCQKPQRASDSATDELESL